MDRSGAATRAQASKASGDASPHRDRMRVPIAAVLYFALTFGAGFVLGPVRILWVVPRLGPRLAELAEMPVMLGVIVVAARWAVRRLAVPPALLPRLGMGGGALALMLAAEFTLVLRLRGMSIGEYFATLDPVSGTAFFAMQGVMAVMPLLVARR